MTDWKSMSIKAVGKSVTSVPVQETSVELGSLGGYLGFRLRRIQNRLSRDFGERTRELGLRSGTVGALGVIMANPGINQIKIARAIGQDASAAVSLLDDLRKRGWIKRARLKQDRRHYSIRLTSEGEAVYRQLLDTLSVVEGKALHVLDPVQLATLSGLLDMVFEACVED